LLASNGIYSSPTGAVGVAGALKAKHRGNVVCIVIDSGLKSNLMLEGFKKRVTRVPDDATLERFMERIGYKLSAMPTRS
jgi:threonine synthase